MILDRVFSVVGRSTQMELESLRRQLGIGTDPAFDYSSQIEQAKMQRSRSTAALREQAMDNDKIPPTLLSGLGSALNAWKDENQPPAEIESDELGAVGRKKEKVEKPTWAFVAQNWQEIHEHEDKLFDKPVCSNLRVKEELTQPRLLIPNFGLRPKNVGVKTMELMKKVEQLKQAGKPLEAADLLKTSISLDHLPEAPMKVGPRMPVHNFDHTVGHKDPDTLCGNVFNVNSFEDNLIGVDKLNGRYDRVRDVNFDKFRGHVPLNEGCNSYFIPGQYKPRYNTVRRRDDKCGVAWNRGNVAEPFKKEEIKVFIPDRSLARICPALERRITVPNIAKQTARPVPGEKIVSETSMKPAHQEEVVRKRMEYDANKAEEYTLRKQPIPDFKNFRSREQGMVGTRTYADDRALQAAKSNLQILSVEKLSVEQLDSPVIHPRNGILIENFDLQRGRDLSPVPARERDKPSRKHDAMKDVSKFCRSPKRGESHCNVGVMSPVTNSVSSMRKARSYNALPDSN